MEDAHNAEPVLVYAVNDYVRADSMDEGSLWRVVVSISQIWIVTQSEQRVVYLVSVKRSLVALAEIILGLRFMEGHLGLLARRCAWCQ